MAIDRRRFLASGAAGLFTAGLSPASRAGTASRFEPAAAEPDAKLFARARRQFLFPTDVTYCNTGTLGACPRDVLEPYLAELERLERELPDWPYFQSDGEPLTGYQRLADVRARVGRFVNADTDEIALTQNATMGMSFIANGLELLPGDEVLTTDQEHSGGIGSWRLRAARDGIVVRKLPLADMLDGGPDAVVDAFRRALTPKTRVLMVSHVTSAFGTRLPARELCALAAEHGVLSVLDGAQAVGQLPVDMAELGCDAYVASPHKWLLAPKGTGFMYVRRDLPQRIWGTLAGSHYADWDTAFRFMQFGTGSVPIVDGLVAALDFVERIGVERIASWDAAVNARLREGLAALPRVTLTSSPDPRFAAAISTFRVDGVSARDLQIALWREKIRVRAQNDANGVRFCCHLYVAPDDVDRALDVIAALA